MVTKQILIVDDEVQTLALLSILFHRYGFMVLKAENARSALNILESTTPDLLIADVMMPEMDGFELCQHVRARFKTATMPIILFSTFFDSRTVQKGIEAGANECITKLTPHRDVLAKVRSMLGIGHEGASGKDFNSAYVRQ